MIRHIVLFKLEDDYSGQEKETIKTELKAKLLELKDKIDELKALSVWFKAEKAVATNSDVMLDTSFDSLDALERYRVHPDHVKVVEHLKTLKLQRASIDFEY